MVLISVSLQLLGDCTEIIKYASIIVKYDFQSFKFTI